MPLMLISTTHYRKEEKENCNMIFETERLILRPWTEEDAESLFEYASDPAVGPIAGWPIHTSVENSREIIQQVLMAEETYAVCLKEDNRAIGSIGLIPPAQSHAETSEDEMEIGYWIGVPFWGKGLIPEAVRKMQEHAFLDLGCSAMWCGYYDGNEKSRRCQEKCGFVYHHTEENKACELMGDVRTEHFTKLTREGWLDEWQAARGQGDKGKMIIRKATADDIDEVEIIYDAVHTKEENDEQTIGWARGVYPVRGTAESALKRNELFVLEDEGRVYGAAIINKTQVDCYAEGKWEYDAPESQVCVLHTLVVSPEAAGRGYGKAFVEYYEKYALENGCCELRMDTNARNKVARAMYKKLGYKEIGIVPTVFNGISGVNLVLLEKYQGEKTAEQ